MDPDIKSASKEDVKSQIETLYDSLADKKTKQLEAWLSHGDRARIPETKTGNYFLDRKCSTALSLLNLPPNARILEIGCQYGFFTFRLVDKGYHVTAADLSQGALDIAQKRAERYGVTTVEFIKQDAENLDKLADNSFDAVVSFSCLRYVPDSFKALQEIYRVIKPGGAVVVDFPNKYSPWFSIVRVAMGVNPHMHDRLYSGKEVCATLEKIGFTNVRIKKILFTHRRRLAVLFPFFKLLDAIGERIYGIRELATIVVAGARKP